jgi:aryl-alcohol dehydrogenase-like predicted oxidoreductase
VRKISIARTELAVSRLGFGTSSLHHLFFPPQRQRVLSAALDAGFTHFDTAPMYGEGMAERSLGKFAPGALRHSLTLATKIGWPAEILSEHFPPALYMKRVVTGVANRVGLGPPSPRKRALSAPDAEASLARSLRALRTDWIDILFIHEPGVEEIGALQELAPWLQRQKASGRARWLGLSGAARSCASVAREMRGVFDILQVEDSLAEREADALRELEWPLQITYGYFRRAARSAREGREAAPEGEAVLAGALARNPAGMVLVSSRKPERLRAMGRLAEQAPK